MNDRFLYCNLKIIGTVYPTRTTLPLCFPGFHLGMELTTRNASSLSNGLPPFIIWGLLIEPSFYYTKLLQKSGIRKNEVIELIYRGFI